MKPETNRPQESGPSRNGPTIPIVGIGASAGGIGALETLVPLFERGAGLAYVVVQHLDPERKSGLTGLLGRTAKIPVTEIADQVTIEADHVYVIPPNAALTISDKRLKISPPVEQRFQRTPIDGFFISLAEANGECSAGVILSGTGSDGTIGLRAIKEHGGLTMAQDDAEYDGMMRSAVGSGMVDFVLPLEKMPARLNDYFRPPDQRRGPQGPGRRAARSGRPPGADRGAFAHAHRPRLQRLQGQDRGAPGAAAHAGAADRRGARLHRAAAQGAAGTRRAAPGPADRRHQLLPRPAGLRGARARGHSAALRGQGTGRHDPRLGARLLDRRGSLFDRHPAARAHAQAARRPSCRSSPATSTSTSLQIARTGRYPVDHRQGHPAGPAGAPFRARGRHLSHRQRPARDLPVLLAQPAARRAVLQARPDHLPQPPDLPDAGAAEPVDPAVPLCAERRRLPVPRHLGERDAPSAPVQHASTSSIASSSASRCSSAGCRNSR